MKLSVPRRLVRTRGMRGQCHRDTVLTPLRRGGGGRLFSTRSVPPYRPATSPPPGTDTSIIRIAPIQPVGCNTTTAIVIAVYVTRFLYRIMRLLSMVPPFGIGAAQGVCSGRSGRATHEADYAIVYVILQAYTCCDAHIGAPSTTAG